MIKYFSEKALQALNGYYVYALIDPRTDKVFYIGKGIGNRVFSHEIESGKSPDSEKVKLKIISSIEKCGLNVKRAIINWGLTENEAFAAEASLINLLNFTSELSNIVAGHHVHESLTVEDFELRYGAELLKEDDIKHNILVIKINRLFRWDMSQKELYDATRGYWSASIGKVRNIEYVFAVYNQIIVGVYKPNEWHFAYEMIDIPRPKEFPDGFNDKLKNRVYFISQDYETLDDNQIFFLHKSISDLKVNKSSQNPITYLMPKNIQKTETLNTCQCSCDKDVYQEPNFDYVIIKTRAERISERGSLYEATRYAWKVGERIKDYKYVLSVVNKVVRAIYIVESWHKIETGKDKGRYEFFGREAVGSIFDSIIGKKIPEKYRKNGMASPLLYKNILK